MKKKIVFITTNRADYNIQKKIINICSYNKKNNINLIISGTHLVKDFGYTKKDLNLKNIKFFLIKNFINSDSKENALNCISSSILSYTKILKKINPHIVVIVGDRYEILPMVICCLILRIKIAHIHGGELTFGSFDDQIRHSISKMSDYHFVIHKKYKNRLIQMGEDKKKIFNFGSPSLDNIKKSSILDISKLSKKFNFNFKDKYFLVCYHPNTSEPGNDLLNLKALLAAIKQIDHIKFIFNYPNSDPKYKIIINELKSFVSTNNKKYILIKNFGGDYFYSAIYYSLGMIGNSSSGIIEVPFFCKPTINLGERQKGREQSNSIINCEFNKKIILKKIKLIIDNKFKFSKNKKVNSIFYKKNSSTLIAKKIEKISLNKKKSKNFYDFKLIR